MRDLKLYLFTIRTKLIWLLGMLFSFYFTNRSIPDAATSRVKTFNVPLPLWDVCFWKCYSTNPYFQPIRLFQNPRETVTILRQPTLTKRHPNFKTGDVIEPTGTLVAASWGVSWKQQLQAYIHSVQVVKTIAPVHDIIFT